MTNSSFFVEEVASQIFRHHSIVRIVRGQNRILDDQLVPSVNAASLVDRVVSWVDPVVTILSSMKKQWSAKELENNRSLGSLGRQCITR